jgi:hypothetical protein
MTRVMAYIPNDKLTAKNSPSCSADASYSNAGKVCASSFNNVNLQFNCLSNSTSTAVKSNKCTVNSKILDQKGGALIAGIKDTYSLQLDKPDGKGKDAMSGMGMLYDTGGDVTKFSCETKCVTPASGVWVTNWSDEPQ